ncbi:sensor histidine kinase [Aureibaculum marinum]|uniref:histidine kinase n=2 Tax=Aureibaculum marinum TaxID=2487930 RepID=A0A3N4NIU8_9FLAO|nr:sensor histidine kinase [Aureibaculum marinum]
MILLVVIASILIALMAVYQYNEQTKDYHAERLERKENTIKATIDLELKKHTTYPVTEENLYKIFSYKDKIYDISDINQLDILIFNLKGELQITSSSSFSKDDSSHHISQRILNLLAESPEHRVVVEGETPSGIKYKSAYTYINDGKFKPIGILHIHYLKDNSFQEEELKEFLSRLAYVYIFMLLFAIGIAYFVSRYISRSIQTVSEKMSMTVLGKSNEKIILEDASLEIFNLVTAYNTMVDKLEKSASKLAKSQREQAWREMAKQVAHEIKNPLTPMRLTVQSFERRFDANDPNIKAKISEFSKSLIQQIDTMSSIASAFSNFAEMPKQKIENLNVVEVVKLALDIFNKNNVYYFYDDEEIIARLDKGQLIRVVTNLVKNSVQSSDSEGDVKVEVRVFQENEKIVITVADNGSGISEEDKDKIFEPKFTTKSSGMGLGLAMVKNIVEAYGGNITFVSELGKGSVFTVTFPKNNK